MLLGQTNQQMQKPLKKELFLDLMIMGYKKQYYYLTELFLETGNMNLFR